MAVYKTRGKRIYTNRLLKIIEYLDSNKWIKYPNIEVILYRKENIFAIIYKKDSYCIRKGYFKKTEKNKHFNTAKTFIKALKVIDENSLL